MFFVKPQLRFELGVQLLLYAANEKSDKQTK